MGEIKEIFQIDSDIVRQTYLKNNNYLIEFNNECKNKTYCAVYFSSNNIYCPNDENTFIKKIIQRNHFEWYHSRISKAYKHVFIRDIFKQWYLAGINSTIDSPLELIEFLKKETKGYKIITIGSSAGGYASILYGSILNAKKIIAFNPQFELNSLLQTSSEYIDPLIFRLENSKLRIYFDIIPFIHKAVNIYYFYSQHSPLDIKQNNYLNNRIPTIHQLSFNTKHHGIPFLKGAVTKVINSNDNFLCKYENKNVNPIFFTINMIGIKKTFIDIIKQIYNLCKKRMHV